MQQRFALWLKPAFGDFCYDHDIDGVDVLSQERAREWARIGNASFLSDDEKREALGYGKAVRAKKEFDAVSVDVGNAELGDGSGDASGGGGGGGSEHWRNEPRLPGGQPGGGQWTTGGGGPSMPEFSADSRASDAEIVSAYILDPNITYGPHDYTQGPTEICSASMACTPEEMADQLSRFAVPGPDPAHPVQSETINSVYDPRTGLYAGDVVTTISNDGLTVTNVTTPLHVFYNEAIVRTVFQGDDGAWYVTTRGTGFNVLPKMYMVNDRQGPKIFGYIDGLLRGNIARYHGQGSD